jgi:branched-chain amino acid transport system substrate-binding protein
MKRTIYLLVGTLVFSFLTITIIGPQPGDCSSKLWDKAVSKQAPSSIKIGGAISKTGMFAAPASHVKTGYEYAVADINERGGVYVMEYGKRIPLELITYDDESDPTKTVSRLERLHSAHNVVAYVGGFSSVLATPGCAVGEKNKTPWIGVAFSVEAPHKQGYSYVFSPYPKSRDYAMIFNAYKQLPESQWPRKLAIWEMQSDWGLEMADMWEKNARNGAYKVVSRKKYPRGTKDFTPLIMDAKNAGADMVVGVPTPPEGVAMFKQMKELDYNPLWTFFVRASTSSAWAKFPEGDYNCLLPNWHSNCKFPMVDKINERYRKEFGRDAELEVGPAYTCIQIIADSIERAGTLDRKAIRDAMSQTNMMTADGHIRFNKDGTADFDYIIINQWQNGKVQCVYPKIHASAPLVFPRPKWSER